MPIAAVAVTDTVSSRDAQITALYDEHAATLRRYVLRLTGDRGRAEDIVQETLLRAWTHLEITGSSARAWLFTVARHLVIDQSRSSRVRHEVGSLEDAPEPAGPDEVDATLDRMLITEAFVRLSPEHREVIRRSYYAGCTTARIAADLGIAEGTVKSRLHYAIRALRLALQEMGVTR
ncbi:sigma-70 family RNA polymerase sigma factor [Mycolicibacter kumamotonensis]|uniref:Sigma-70 family RNA polymerase sigma factor n=1 Tax=Mycolicibacter kumamotonensis TaxID=354243 RepID=A0A7K3LGW0_9MYCO|nr:sigma-70 family RNA polymerase sigma factor [Mycolicibacter kumamotonensis]NDJ91370.1 sigma-70 family RNA polymerase sigma factor [Mycolicibacter kumamotonensis]